MMLKRLHEGRCAWQDLIIKRKNFMTLSNFFVTFHVVENKRLCREIIFPAVFVFLAQDFTWEKDLCIFYAGSLLFFSNRAGNPATENCYPRTAQYFLKFIFFREFYFDLYCYIWHRQSSVYTDYIHLHIKLIQAK